MSFIKIYWKALFWAFLILGACGINGNSIPKVSFDLGIDKIAHFTLFLVQAILIYLAQKKNIVGAILISSAYGILIEFMQMTVFVNRSFDYADMLADVIGAVVCYPLILIWRNVNESRLKLN